MREALRLAERGLYTVSPNPAVGAVIVKNGEIVGKGYHRKAGEPHAEVYALREAGEKAKGATAYVTLEPCSHYGRTPPCAEALIKAGVSRVVAAMVDPNPKVSGKGIARLREAGIEADTGLLSDEAEALNRGFLQRMRTGRPYVRLKLGISIDGRTALNNGVSHWITSSSSRSDVQRYRAMSSAIMSTSETLKVDNPTLSVRWNELPLEVQSVLKPEEVRQPVRVIVDSRSRVTGDKAVFSVKSPILLLRREKGECPEGASEILFPGSGQLQLATVMRELGRREINDLWIEAGGHFAGALIEANLADEIILYMAPTFLGSKSRPLAELPEYYRLEDAPSYEIENTSVIGPDLKVVLRKRH